jgi:hypothetical protein
LPHSAPAPVSTWKSPRARSTASSTSRRDHPRHQCGVRTHAHTARSARGGLGAATSANPARHHSGHRRGDRLGHRPPTRDQGGFTGAAVPLVDPWTR